MSLPDGSSYNGTVQYLNGDYNSPSADYFKYTPVNGTGVLSLVIHFAPVRTPFIS
jgi:hypothetical protein